MKKYLLLLALVCLLGNGALAQDRGITKPVTVTIDFSGWNTHDGNYNVDAEIVWNDNSNSIQSIHGTNGDGRVIDYTQYPISVGTKSAWGLSKSGTHGGSYLQKNAESADYFSITNLKTGDVVTIWGDNGNQVNGGCTAISGTEDNVKFTLTSEGKQLVMSNGNELRLYLEGQYSGIRKITIQTTERAEDYFNYDPGYEDYDMYDEFSKNDPKKWTFGPTNNGYGPIQLDPQQWSTSYTLSEEETGITLNGQTAQYIVLSGSKITANNRIAIDGNAGTWRFNYGLRAPNVSGQWANFSICNLKEGDRVVFSYTGTAPKFSSNGENGSYNGAKAFADQYNDGIFDEGEDVYITSGANPRTDWDRDEGNFYLEDNGSQGNYKLYYTRPYVITEDGHLDIAIAPDTRIVKIKIYSDHQATMIDEYDTQTESYVAKFDITGELQAKEHIMPGGLEVHVGSDDASQHANVISSAHGPVSIVNGVNGYKLPGMTTNANGNLQFEFDLASNIPTTGTFYKFMPLENGQMTLTFQAASMNYYSYSFNGDAVYYGHSDSYTDNSGWTEKFDRPNEQTRNVECPYYLVKVTVGPNGTLSTPSKVKFTYRIKNSNGETSEGTIDPISNDESKRVLKALNGADITISPVDEVKDNEIYYLYGGWNATGLYFYGSGQGQNNLEYFPNDPYDGSTNGNGGKDKACGVAKLLEVVFNPNRKVYPLAKWVPNGTSVVGYDDENVLHGVPNPDTFAAETYLADLWGYDRNTKITVKKMSGNILSCNPYIEEIPQNQQVEGGPTARLMIKDITFVDGKDQGGTILIKIGNTDNKSNPVYTLTIAYSADPTYDGNSGTGTRGHIWDFSTNSLHGFDWAPSSNEAPKRNNNGDFINDLSASSKYAQPVDYGHYFDDYFAANISQYSSADDVFTKLGKSGSGLLYREINAQGTHSRNTDWSFNYNLVNAGNLYDPLFMNKYDTEGDNADLIWETEGTVIIADANASVMFNEFTGTDIHSSEKDPERYVGILNSKNSEFRIPWLMPNDRVIIYMGTGKGAFNDQAVFNIRGAYDAVHNVIDPTDDYIVGGSHWNVVKNEQGQVVTNDPYYRGCYHFFAQGHNGGPADMVFKMTSGSMCKIYKIQIYRGDRIITNEVVANDPDTDKFLLWSRAKDPNDTNDTDYTEENRPNWTLQYFGKDQKLADGSNGVNNDIVAQTGDIKNTSSFSTDATNNTFTYQHQLGEIGTIRVRGKDMEKNMKYVADYGEHNVTVAYQETQPYPYTWDFMDMTGWGGNTSSGNKAKMFDPEEAYQASTTPPDWFNDFDDNTDDGEVWKKSYEFTSKDLSLWESYSGTDGYFLRLNSQNSQTDTNPKEKDNIFQTDTDPDSDYEGNQVWANKQVVPETKGLWFLTNNNFNHSSWYISDEGMDFDEKAHKIVVPNVPADAAVYLRMEKIKNDKIFSWQWNSDCEVYGDEPQQVGSTSDYIFAIKNNGSKRNLVLSIKGYRLLKLAVSTDPKTVNEKGWASESRDHVIDPELTAYMTGYDLETCIVTDVDYDKKTVTLTRVHSNPSSNTSTGNTTTNINGQYVMRALSDGAKGASIIHNKDNNKVEILSIGTTTNPKKGFHLFVPDMHDYTEGASNNQKSLTHENSENNKNLFVAQVTPGTILASSGDYTNYALSYKYYKLNPDGTKTGSQQIGDEAFYRIAYNTTTQGASSSGNQGYLPLLTSKMNPYYVENTGGNNNPAKFTIIFEDEFENITPGITTTIDDIESSGRVVTSEGFYNLNGQKMNGIPTQKGMYIVNGKKVLVK